MYGNAILLINKWLLIYSSATDLKDTCWEKQGDNEVFYKSYKYSGQNHALLTYIIARYRPHSIRHSLYLFIIPSR